MDSQQNLDPYEILDTMAANLLSGAGKAPTAHTEQGADNPQMVGRSSRVGKRRHGLYSGIDVFRALGKPIYYGVTTDFIMPPDEAAATMKGLIAGVALDKEADEVQFAFTQALLLCLALNSASLLMPGRAEFHIVVGGVSSTFNLYHDAVAKLGNNSRRFFRAYADETRIILKSWIAKFLKGQVGSGENAILDYERTADVYDSIMRVAHNRGLVRVPDLIHDSAEACSQLTQTEKTFLAASKKTIFAEGGVLNEVDNPVVPRTAPGGRAGALASAPTHGSLGPDY